MEETEKKKQNAEDDVRCGHRHVPARDSGHRLILESTPSSYKMVIPGQLGKALDGHIPKIHFVFDQQVSFFYPPGSHSSVRGPKLGFSFIADVLLVTVCCSFVVRSRLRWSVQDTTMLCGVGEQKDYFIWLWRVALNGNR